MHMNSSGKLHLLPERVCLRLQILILALGFLGVLLAVSSIISAFDSLSVDRQ